MRRQYRVLNEILLSRTALLHNYHYFQKLQPQAHIAPVLKSNAYGHGLTQVAKVIDKNTKAPYICVDSLYEAYELQKNRNTTPVLIIGYTFPENFNTIKRLPFAFSVFDLDTLAALNKYQPGAKVHIKIDTGMTRLGIQPNQVTDFIKDCKKYSNLTFVGIYSHLSQADDPAKNTNTHKQVKIFKAVIQQFKTAGFTFKWRHLTNTAGTSLIIDPEFNLARVGLGLYGLSPFGAHTKPGSLQRKALRPVLSLTSHLAQIKTIAPGTSVGYGGIHRAKHTERIGVLPLGYNEGLNRNLSNKAVVLDKNHNEYPIIGNISMNMTTIKIPRTSKARVGDTITIISNTPSHPNSVYQLSNLLKTIPYTIVTGLHPSIRRSLNEH